LIRRRIPRTIEAAAKDVELLSTHKECDDLPQHPEMSPAIQQRGPSHRFEQPDLSEYVLGLPKSRPQFWSWMFVAIVAGTLLALALFAISNLIF
jgi:hypothetical protein